MEDNLQDKIQSILSDPESMQQLSELAQMFQNGDHAQSDTGTASQPSGMPDAAMLLKLSEMFQSSASNDKNTALLQALKPHLSEERCRRADKAMRLLKLWAVFQTMQKSGMLQELF